MRLRHVLPLLALALAVFPPIGLASDPTTGPAAILDWAALQPATAGHQVDKGFRYPDDLRLVKIVAVPLVQDARSGDLYFIDPEELSEGKVSARRYLIAVAANGTITASKRARALTKAEAERRLRQALLQFRSDVASRLPSELSRMAPQAIAAVVQAFWGWTGRP